MKQLVYKKWITSDEWSGVEDNGYSLHKTEDDLKQFIAKHWEKYPSSTPPPFYSAPDIFSSTRIVSVTDDVYDQVAASDCGLRFYDKIEYGEVVQ